MRTLIRQLEKENSSLHDLFADIMNKEGFFDDLSEDTLKKITNGLIDIEDFIKEKIHYYSTSNEEIIENLIKDEFDYYFYQLDVKSRKEDVREARQTAMFLLQKYTDMNLTQIGRKFGKKHDTVIWAINKINKLAKTDRLYKQVRRVENKLISLI